MIEFTAGIMIKNKKVLLLCRSEYEDEIGKWNPPNETIEENEDPSAAVIRGVKEETNLDYKIDKLLFEHIFNNKKTNVYLGTVSGELKIDKRESSAYGWFSYEDAKELEYAFGYDKLIERLHELELF